jgi:hypothetical protein
VPPAADRRRRPGRRDPAELASAPALWHQRAYLARVISLDPADGPRDEGIVPLAAFVDGLGDDGTEDALALTLEADGAGAIYPVIYLRRGGRVEERPIDPGSAAPLRHAGGHARVARSSRGAVGGRCLAGRRPRRG